MLTETRSMDTRSLSQRLREDTRVLHTQAEHQPFQTLLIQGRLPAERYADYLGQMLLVHRTLDGQLRQLRATHPQTAALIQDYHFQEPYLRADLAFWKRDADQTEGLPATRDFCHAIERAHAKCPLASLGTHYVLEGSKNGAKYIAKSLWRAYRLAPGPGTLHLDPYDDKQMEYWQQFKTALDALPCSPAESDAILETARAAFVGIMRVVEPLTPA